MLSIVCALCCAVAFVALGDARAQLGPALSLLVLWGFAVWAAPKPAGGPARVLLVALLIRAVLLLAPLSLSDDLYRYLWEGRVVTWGGNPYSHPPSWEGWPPDPIRALVNHKEIPTIYPPVAMAMFAGFAAVYYDPITPRVAFGLCDALLAGALALTLRGRGRRLDAAWLYALHPLGAVEAAGSGHLDAAALLGLVLAVLGWDRATRRGRGDAGVTAAVLGAGVKLFPALLLPALLRAPGPRRARGVALAASGALVLALSAPFWDAGAGLTFAFRNYVSHWSFNGSLFPLLERGVLALGGPVLLARRLGVLAGGIVVAGALWRRRDPAEVALWAGGAFVLLSPTVHPWYVTLAWVPALLCGVRAWTLLATAAPIAYAVLATLDPATGRWQEPEWTRPLIYLPFLALLLAEWCWRQIRAGPWLASACADGSASPCPTTPAPSTARAP